VVPDPVPVRRTKKRLVNSQESTLDDTEGRTMCKSNLASNRLCFLRYFDKDAREDGTRLKQVELYLYSKVFVNIKVLH